MLINFLFCILLSATISFFITPLVRNYYIKHRWVEDPIERKRKSSNVTALTAVPRGGGLPIFISLFVVALLLIPLDKHLIGILVAAFITLIIGVWDDIKDISPKIRLFTNLLAALVVVGFGIGIAYISNPFGGILDFSTYQINFNLFGPHSIWVISDILAIIWIIWCMNITGWSAGVEGQLPGFVAISAFFIGLLGFRYYQDPSQWPVIILSGIVSGAYLGFLPFNFYPQTIMPGYSGKSLAGLLLAILSILSGAKLATLILLLGVPMIDAGFVLLRRLLNHRSLIKSDGQHLHHLLLKIGWSRSRISIFYWLISLFLGTLSLFLNSQQKLYIFIGLFLFFLVFVMVISRRK